MLLFSSLTSLICWIERSVIFWVSVLKILIFWILFSDSSFKTWILKLRSSFFDFNSLINLSLLSILEAASLNCWFNSRLLSFKVLFKKFKSSTLSWKSFDFSKTRSITSSAFFLDYCSSLYFVSYSSSICLTHIWNLSELEVSSSIWAFNFSITFSKRLFSSMALFFSSRSFWRRFLASSSIWRQISRS